VKPTPDATLVAQVAHPPASETVAPSTGAESGALSFIGAASVSASRGDVAASCGATPSEMPLLGKIREQEAKPAAPTAGRRAESVERHRSETCIQTTFTGDLVPEKQTSPEGSCFGMPQASCELTGE
jgi:hypothetical protein